MILYGIDIFGNVVELPNNNVTSTTQYESKEAAIIDQIEILSDRLRKAHEDLLNEINKK